MNRTFTCPRCRTKFAWKDSYLNKRVSCKCGCVFDALEDQPEQPHVDPYEMALDDAGQPVPPAPTVARPAPAVGAGGVPLTPYPTRGVRAAQSEEGVDEGSTLKNLVLPGVLMAAGAGLLLLQSTLDPPSQATTARTILLGVMFMAIMIVTMLAGGGVSALLLGIEFGSLGKVAYKFAGIAMLAAGVGVVVAGLDPEPTALRGKVIAWHVVVILYWICFQFFFDLDLQENVMSVAIIGLLQAVTACVLWRL